MRFAYYGSKEPKESLVYELLLTSPPALIAVDVEAVSLELPEPVGLSIAVSPTDSFYFPIMPEPSPFLEDVINILRDTSITKVFHNALFDLKVLSEYKIDQTNINDTLIMAHLLGFRDADLQSLATLVGIFLPDFPKIKQWIWELTEEQIAQKCCLDAEATLKVYHRYIDEVDRDYLRSELQLIPILLAMSAKGMKIDQQLRAELEAELIEDIAFYESQAEDLGFNPGSPKQVAYMLAKDGVFLPYTKKRKSLKTDEDTLVRVPHPLAALTLNYRKSKKLLSTYIKPLANTDRCYTRFHLDAVTGRVTSTHRNLQNIPKGKMRNIFMPDNDVFTDLDFNQIELRVLAHFSQDKRMLSVFSSGGDIHQTTADFMEIPRSLAKNVNFSMVYGATDETIATTAGISNIRKATELKTSWGFQYPQAMDWILQQQKKTDYVTTLYNRKIPLPLGEDDEAVKRKAVNYAIQASAAEIVKRAMVLIATQPRLAEALRLQVHDELLFDGNVFKELEQLDLQHIAALETPYNIKLLERWE